MKTRPSQKARKLYIILVMGEEKPGTVATVTQFLFKKGFNIIDVEQFVVHSHFTMVLIVRPFQSTTRLGGLEKGLGRLAKELKVSVTVKPFSGIRTRHSKTKDTYVLTILGSDRPGIVAVFSAVITKHHCSIRKIRIVAMGDLPAMELWFDLGKANFRRVRRNLHQTAKQTGMDIVLQPERIFLKEKKVALFDMDSTIVEEEVINELAELAGAGETVTALTEKGMRGKIDFAKSLRLRVSYLRGLSVGSLTLVAKRLRLTKGSKELIRALKKRGLKVALVSGGFNYFTERMKKQLGFDYAFGNELEIKNGKLTGRVKGRIIDARRKAEILEEVCRQEGVTPEEAIAVGDGSNDRIMVANAGLGIAFNAKEILKEVADGVISKGRIKGVLYCLGPSEASDKLSW